MELLQEKLDVIQKKRSNLFNWRGQFTPEFVEYLLSYLYANKIQLFVNATWYDPENALRRGSFV